MSTVEEEVEDQNDRISYRVKIKKFRDKMLNWPPGKEVELNPFYFQDNKFSLMIRPSGSTKEDKGYVSIFLRNEGSRRIQVNFEIKLDNVIRTLSSVFSPWDEGEDSWGFSKFYPHKTCANYGH